MNTRTEPLEADTEPTAAPVTGELVTPPEASVIPSAAQQNATADRARGRTVTQVGLPSAVVIVGTWAARLAGIDLNPLPGTEDMPPEVVAAFIVIATAALAFRMNPKRKPE